MSFLSFSLFPADVSICLETRARLMSPRAAGVCRILFWMRRDRDEDLGSQRNWYQEVPELTRALCLLMCPDCGCWSPLSWKHEVYRCHLVPACQPLSGQQETSYSLSQDGCKAGLPASSCFFHATVMSSCRRLSIQTTPWGIWNPILRSPPSGTALASDRSKVASEERPHEVAMLKTAVDEGLSFGELTPDPRLERWADTWTQRRRYTSHIQHTRKHSHTHTKGEISFWPSKPC